MMGHIREEDIQARMHQVWGKLQEDALLEDILVVQHYDKQDDILVCTVGDVEVSQLVETRVAVD
jgi:uncharacterized protein (UPF0218 family)